MIIRSTIVLNQLLDGKVAVSVRLSGVLNHRLTLLELNRVFVLLPLLLVFLLLFELLDPLLQFLLRNLVYLLFRRLAMINLLDRTVRLVIVGVFHCE